MPDITLRSLTVTMEKSIFEAIVEVKNPRPYRRKTKRYFERKFLDSIATEMFREMVKVHERIILYGTGDELPAGTIISPIPGFMKAPNA